MNDADGGRAALVEKTRHIFLSPHYDDIALSAGATVAQLADFGLQPETVILFGSEPDPGALRSPFAEAMHAGWGLSAEAVVRSRQAEEAAAAAILGATTRILPFQDAIYRGHRYLSDHELFGHVSLEERSLPAEIAGALSLDNQPDAETRFYAPLAIGSHVDHQLAFHAATLLAAGGWNVWFYEDAPYVLKADALAARFDKTDSDLLEPAALVPAAAGWERKIDAILCYPSQLETIFRHYVGVGDSRREISDALDAYARSIGNGAAVERFWKMKSSPSISGS